MKRLRSRGVGLRRALVAAALFAGVVSCGRLAAQEPRPDAAPAAVMGAGGAGVPVRIRIADAETGGPVAAYVRIRVGADGPVPAEGSGHDGWVALSGGVWTGTLRAPEVAWLEVRAAGYRATSRRLPTPLPASIEVRLERAVLRLPDLDATVRRSATRREIRSWRPDRTAGPDLGSWLRSLPGVAVRSRGAGGEQLVSVRGSRPQAVRVLLDGIPVTDPFRGTADLSLFPEATLGGATLATGAGAGGAGWGGMAGTLSLESRLPDRGARLRLATGSFGRLHTGLDAGWQAGGLRLGVAASRESARNDFRFANRIVPGTPTERRTNADFGSWSLLGRAEVGSAIRVLARADGVERGAPGRMGNHVWDEARWRERRRSLGVRWLAGETAEIAASWSDLSTEFRDPRTGRRSVVDGAGWTARGGLTTPADVRVSWEAATTTVTGDAFPRGATRRTASVRLERDLALTSRLTLAPAAAIDVAGEGAALSPAATLRWDASDHWSLWGRAGQARRLPTFADIALDPGTGARPNPDLAPEHVVLDAEGGAEWRPSGRLSARAVGFYRRTRSPILWLPSVVGIWSPANLGRLEAVGAEAAAEWAPAPAWRLDARITWQRSRVGFDDGATSPVPYEPALAGGIGVRGGNGVRSVWADLEVIGRRRTNIFGPHDLPPYAVLDIRGRQAFTLMGRRFHADVGILNALGARYERVELFPEPGRRLELGLALSLGGSGRLPDGGSGRSFADAEASDVGPSSGAGAPTSHRH